jgi:putative ABC transport system substrate-binding protein
MGRARLIAALALGLFAWSLSAGAQQPEKVPRLGILSDESPSLGAKTFEPFAQGLRDLGYIEGQNIAFERRYAAEDYEILPGLAAELVGLQPDAILAIGTPAAQAAKSATQTIPVVFARISDPVGLGFVATLARPGGNLTGVSLQLRELAAKRLELLITAVPSAKRVGVLWDPRLLSGVPELREIELAARSLNVELLPAELRDPDDFAPAIRVMLEQRAGALFVVPGPIFTEHIHRILNLTAGARLPTMVPRRDNVEAGGPDIVRAELARHVSAPCGVCGQDFEGRQAGRSPSRAADQVRARHQPQDRQGAGSHHPVHIAWPRRRGDRVMSAVTFSGVRRLKSHGPS